MTQDLGYEAARAELADVVRRLESGGQTLEESLALWERGEQLADICQRWLQDATIRLDTAIEARERRPTTSEVLDVLSAKMTRSALALSTCVETELAT